MVSIPISEYQNTYSRSMVKSPVRLKVNLSNIAKNVDYLRTLIGNRKIIAIVKADGYGLGSVPVAKILEKKDINFLGVSNINEANELKSHGIRTPIFIISPFIYEELDDIVQNSFVSTVVSTQHAFALNNHAARLHQKASCFLKIDTGMGRFGTYYKEAIPFIESCLELKNLNILGLYSHLAQADDLDPSYTQLQTKRFSEVIEYFNAKNVKFQINHLANSSAILQHPDTYFDAVRPGLMLYGSYTQRHMRDRHQLHQVVHLTSHIRDIKVVAKDTFVSYSSTYQCPDRLHIAVVPVGYAEGYPISLSNKGKMFVKGKPAPVVGRVTMDFTMIDVTHIPNVAIGDEVAVIGQEQPLEDFAYDAGILPYQALTSNIGNVSRVYTSE